MLVTDQLPDPMNTVTITAPLVMHRLATVTTNTATTSADQMATVTKTREVTNTMVVIPTAIATNAHTKIKYHRLLYWRTSFRQ